MSTDTTVGEISLKINLESHVEWTVQDIFCDTAVDTCYDSPRFSVPGSEWYLQMFPNGESEEYSVGWIGLYLMRASEDSIPPIEVKHNFGLKKVDGKVEVILSYATHVFDEKDNGWGNSEFLHRSQLLKRKSELAPSGALKVTSTLRVKSALDCISRLIALSDDLKNLLTSANGSDTTLKVQNREFLVHRSILVSRSQVLGAMFEVDMKEKSTGTVNIVDCDPEAFVDFLVYIYSGRFQISSDVIDLYKIAHKYCTEGLKSDCVRFILSNLSVDSVIEIAVLGDQFDEDEFKSKSQEFFDENFELIVATKEWGSLLRKNPSLGNQLLRKMARKRK